MNRREALQLLAGAAALELAPPNVFGRLRAARMLLGTETSFRTLSSEQNATVTMMAEMILPKTKTAGATDAGASQFIDLILTEWYSEEERKLFLNGVSDVDARAQKLFGKQFVECSAEQRGQILTTLGEEMMAAAQHGAHGYRGTAPRPDKNFYYMMRDLTLTAYYTSEVGAR